MSDGVHGCGPECEPWITATHCGVTKLDHATGELLGVRCPSKICRDLVVPLVAGRIAPHTAPVGAIHGRCPWTGIRVVDDRAPFQGEVTELHLTNPCNCVRRAGPVMNYDARAEAEIDVLTEVLAAFGNAAGTATGRTHNDADRMRLFAVVLYELIASARSVAGPDTGRLYAAPILDPVVEGAAIADEVSAMDLLILTTLERRPPRSPGCSD